VSFPQSLGWIYVSEGSTLGAAFLLKEAQAKFGFNAEFGARNLAAYPEGRGLVWKRFKQTLDEANFSSEDQQLIIEGAMQGFQRFGELLAQLKTLK
jgi:heme oxygenase